MSDPFVESEPGACPFCASSDVDVFDRDVDMAGAIGYYVACHCGAWGPTSATQQGAIRAWNRRPAPGDVDGEICDERDENDMKGHRE